MLKQFGLFDSHFHITDKQYPLVANNGFMPDEFTCADYLQYMSAYNLYGGVIVSGSFQAFDQTYLLAALEQLGPSFVAVTQLPATVSDEEIMHLNQCGVRAIRFNLKRGGSETIKHLSSLASRIYELADWHIELYINSKELDELYQTLIQLPAVSIDHLGLSQSGLGRLTRLVEKGIRVKATGFGRLDFKISQVLKDLYSANPEALMFGTDLPSTRAPRPYKENDFLLVIDTLGPEAAKNIFSQNAINFYRPGKNSDQ